jgi:hypothetical protein
MLDSSPVRRSREDNSPPRWLSPNLRDGVASQPIVFAWRSVSGADAYVLKVGTEPGRGDLVRSARMNETRYVVDGLPGGRPLHARILARRGGVWRHTDLAFVASPQAAEWVHPRPGAPDANPRRPIEWTAVPDANEYSISIGSAPRRFDLVNLSTGKRTHWLPTQLPVRRRLFGRIGTRIGSTWRYRDADFAFDLGYRAASITHPAPGRTADGSRPFAWSADPMAGRYRLRIGSAEGRSDLHDSGPIGVSETFVTGLPPGRRFFGTLTTFYADRTIESRFVFRAGPGNPGEGDAVAAALRMTAAMRGMAGYDAAWPRTILDKVVRDAKTPGPGCEQFADALLRALADQNNPLPVRRLGSCLLANTYDCHTLVEVYLPSRRSWMILDPTFGVAARRRSNGQWASAADISSAVRRGDWDAISYVPLAGDSLDALRSYYIDYPLLFVSPFGEEGPTTKLGPSILRYYTEVSLPVRGRGAYAVRCPERRTVNLLVDERPTTLVCSGTDSLSAVRVASSIEPPDAGGSTARVYRLRRFVF